MSYDKLYDMILARRETRTTTTLTMATIASSASLLLFIFYLQPENLDVKSKILIPILGIVFPLIGISYREITYKYIHKHDNTILNALLLKDVNFSKRREIKYDVILYNKHRITRDFLLRLLFIFPIFGWVIISFDWIPGLILNILIIMFVFAVSLPSRIPENKDFPETEIPDFLKIDLD